MVSRMVTHLSGVASGVIRGGLGWTLGWGGLGYHPTPQQNRSLRRILELDWGAYQHPNSLVKPPENCRETGVVGCPLRGRGAPHPTPRGRAPSGAPHPSFTHSYGRR